MTTPLGYTPQFDIDDDLAGANSFPDLSILNLETILRYLLDHAKTRLKQAGVNVDRAVITPGTPAWDSSCGLLADWVTGISPNYSGSGAGRCLASYDVSISLGFYECVSAINDQGRPPSALQVTADGVKIVNHMALLLQTITCDLALSDQLGPVILQSWTPADPQGGMAGGVWRFSVNVMA